MCDAHACDLRACLSATTEQALNVSFDGPENHTQITIISAKLPPPPPSTATTTTTPKRQRVRLRQHVRCGGQRKYVPSHLRRLRWCVAHCECNHYNTSNNSVYKYVPNRSDRGTLVLSSMRLEYYTYITYIEHNMFHIIATYAHYGPYDGGMCYARVMFARVVRRHVITYNYRYYLRCAKKSRKNIHTRTNHHSSTSIHTLLIFICSDMAAVIWMCIAMGPHTHHTKRYGQPQRCTITHRSH